MADVSDLFVGPCTLYVDGTSVGWTRGGIRMRVNKSLWARPSFDGLGAEEVIKQSEDYYISTILVETTMANLRRAWGINEAAVGRRVDFGGSTTVPTHSLRFIAEGNFFELYLYKVSAVDFGEIAFSPRADAFIPVTFRALLDTTKAVGAQIGYVIRGSSSTLDLVCRLIVPTYGTKSIVSRLIVHAEGSSNLISQVDSFGNGTNNFICRLAVTS